VRNIWRLPWAATLRSALALVALSTGGCSWSFTQPLRDDRSPYDYPVCSTHPAPPVADTSLFVLNAGTTIYAAAADNVSQKALPVSVGATAATLYLLSAVYGYVKISQCMSAVARYETGYHRPAIGTGGEVFLQQVPPPEPAPDHSQDLLPAKPRPDPLPTEKP
jgi:hypothetical protein